MMWGWRNERGSALGCELAADRFAVFAQTVVENDFGAARPRALDLRGRRVARHDDHGRRTERRGDRRDCLGVVAGRERDDAARLFRGREPADEVVGAAQLERADRLQALGLHQQAAADGF